MEDDIAHSAQLQVSLSELLVCLWHRLPTMTFSTDIAA